MDLKVDLAERSYTVTVERGALHHVEDRIPLDGKTLVVTDDGVPENYAATVARKASVSGQAVTVTVAQGEQSKNFENYEMLCRVMLENGFTRKDRVIAVGGGVVGDLAGFAASTYMRGIAFYNIPTTLLSQVDSSVGGKTAIDVCSVKNIVGTFYQPGAVIIDPEVLKTLAPRQFSAGMAEVLKMAATCDGELFALAEKGVGEKDLEKIIFKALSVKRRVVENDEREQGLRRVLNFGHTLGHGIESCTGLLHGECVGLGMLCMCSEKVYERLKKALEVYRLPTELCADREKILDAVTHDKKIQSGAANAVFVNEIGTFEIVRTSFEELSRRLTRVIRQ